jgi:uncharacterized damage-inducible protein DinB
VKSSSWFVDLAKNNAWSSARLYAACARLTPAELVAPRTSFFPTILGTLAHIAIVDEYYADGVEQGGRGASIWAREEALAASFEAVRAAQRAVDARLVTFTEGLDDATLARVVGLERRDGRHEDRIGDILLHLFLHQVHHRGQVHAMLSGTSVAPPQLDEFFLREDRKKALDELAGATRG